MVTHMNCPPFGREGWREMLKSSDLSFSHIEPAEYQHTVNVL